VPTQTWNLEYIRQTVIRSSLSKPQNNFVTGARISNAHWTITYILTGQNSANEQGSHASLKVIYIFFLKIQGVESTCKEDRCLQVLKFHSTGPWKSLNSPQGQTTCTNKFIKQHLYSTGMHILLLTYKLLTGLQENCRQVSCLHGLSICQVFCLKQHLLMFYCVITVPSSHKYTLNIAVLLRML